MLAIYEVLPSDLFEVAVRMTVEGGLSLESLRSNRQDDGLEGFLRLFPVEVSLRMTGREVLPSDPFEVAVRMTGGVVSSQVSLRSIPQNFAFP